VDDVDQLYNRVVEILNLASYYAVPKRKKNFFKVLVGKRYGRNEGEVYSLM